MPILVDAGRPLSILELSELAELPYATAHAALHGLRQVGLVVSKSRGRQLLFAANKRNEDAQVLLRMLSKDLAMVLPHADRARRKPTEQDVVWNLARLGAPLVVSQQRGTVLPVEDTLASALALVRVDPTMARAFPLVLAVNFNVLNYPRLRFLAKEAGRARILGFFLDLTGALTGRAHLKDLAADLLDRRVKRDEPFFKVPTSEYAAMLANRKNPPLARKWHFTVNMDMNDFRSFFLKFRHGSKNL